MKELMERINAAYQLTGTVFVNDQNLDRLAAARQALLVAYDRAKTLLEEEEKRAGEKDDENGEKGEEVTADGNGDGHPAEDAE